MYPGRGGGERRGGGEAVGREEGGGGEAWQKGGREGEVHTLHITVLESIMPKSTPAAIEAVKKGYHEKGPTILPLN